jgi:uncharacterized protein (TIGR03437 family)
VTLIGTTSGTIVAIDPVFTNVIYLASSGYNVMRSTDGGITWSKAGVITGAETVITDPRWSGFVYAATGSPIYKSNNFGTSWAVSSQGMIPKGDTPAIMGLFLDPQFGNTIFAAASGLCASSPSSQQCGLFRSEDGGLSWTNLGLPGRFSSVAFDSATGDYYAGGNVTGPGNVVLKSSDGGFTFSPIKNGFGGGADGPSVYTDPSASSTVYAIGSISGVYLRSTDRGVTWTGMSFPRDCTGMGCSSAPVVVSRLAFAATPSSASLSNLSNASFKGGPLAPESMVAAFGSNLATGSASSNSDPLPTSLLGTTVSVMDSAGAARQAPLFYVSAAQVIYEVPPGTALGRATVTIKSGGGASSSQQIQVGSVSPGIFTINSAGLVAANVLRVSNGNQTYEDVYQMDPSGSGGIVARPIDLGPSTDAVYLLLYATGLRAAGTGGVSVKIGGVDAPVLFAGANGQFVSVDQVNVQIPRSLAGRGDVALVLKASGSQAYTTHLTIQ